MFIQFSTKHSLFDGHFLGIFYGSIFIIKYYTFHEALFDGYQIPFIFQNLYNALNFREIL